MKTRRSIPDAERRDERLVVLRPDFDDIASGHALWAQPEARPTDECDRLVREAVASGLTAKQREVIEMHFFEGLSQGAIARRLGVTQQVVQKRIYGVERDGRRIGGALSRLRSVLSVAMNGDTANPQRTHER